MKWTRECNMKNIPKPKVFGKMPSKKELKIDKLLLQIQNDFVKQIDNTNMNYDKFTVSERAS